MGRIVATEFVTIDGRMDDPGEWTPAYFDEEVQQIKSDEYFGAAALLFGATTFRIHAAAWPSADDDFARRLNTMQKYVVSTTADPTTWGNTVAITEQPVERIRQLKQDTEGDILLDGSGRLLDLLLREDLVDRVDLLVFPEVYGRGKYLFKDDVRAQLRLRTATALQAGALHLVYDL